MMFPSAPQGPVSIAGTQWCCDPHTHPAEPIASPRYQWGSVPCSPLSGAQSGFDHNVGGAPLLVVWGRHWWWGRGPLGHGGVHGRFSSSKKWW